MQGNIVSLTLTFSSTLGGGTLFCQYMDSPILVFADTLILSILLILIHVVEILSTKVTYYNCMKSSVMASTVAKSKEKKHTSRKKA